MAKTKLEQYLSDQLDRYKGVRMPVKAGVLERIFKKKVPIQQLHPNPADEFCIEEIGPSYRIIGDYEEKFRKAEIYDADPIEEPVIVEKMLPDGYMILNGHHRWVAAMNCGIKKIPVRIVNPTQETDIRRMIANSKHDKRATFDLDEVVFHSEDDSAWERDLSFPLSRIYHHRLKRGVPTVFHTLAKNGYDIWLYSAQFYSLDYIEHLFRRYHVHVDGIVTGTVRAQKGAAERKEKAASLEQLIASNYKETLNIDNAMIMRFFDRTKEPQFYDLECSDADWSKKIVTLLEGIIKEGEDGKA